MSDAAFGTFFIPGPTEVRPEILAQMTRPVIGHRGKNFEGMFARIEAGLRDVFLTARPVYVGATSSTGFMEMAIRNAPEGKILSLVNGGFSERFAKIAEACERQVGRVIRLPWGLSAQISDPACDQGICSSSGCQIASFRRDDAPIVGVVLATHGVPLLASFSFSRAWAISPSSC